MGYKDEFKQILEFLSKGLADLKPIITHRFLLDEMSTALKTAAKVDEAVKILIELPD